MALRYKNHALTPYNVAAIGAIDDFYDLYVAIQEIYELQENRICETHEKEQLDLLRPDDLCREQVLEACEPIIEKYISVFTDDYKTIPTNAGGFDVFSFLNWKHRGLMKIELSYVSFSQFLDELQFTVTSILWYKKREKQPKYAFERLQEEINSHIVSYVQENTMTGIVPDDEPVPVTDEVLYVYENLIGVGCCIKKHPIIDARFVADSATDSGKIVLPVHYCTKCGKYFIGRITLSLFERNYGKLLVRKRKLIEEEGSFSRFNEESKLYQLGYNVSDGRTDAERQKHLVMLLEKNYISRVDMVKCIELNIQTHSDKVQAVTKWKRDLKYICDYAVLRKK